MSADTTFIGTRVGTVVESEPRGDQIEYLTSPRKRRDGCTPAVPLLHSSTYFRYLSTRCHPASIPTRTTTFGPPCCLRSLPLALLTDQLQTAPKAIVAIAPPLCNPRIRRLSIAPTQQQPHRGHQDLLGYPLSISSTSSNIIQE